MCSSGGGVGSRLDRSTLLAQGGRMHTVAPNLRAQRRMWEGVGVGLVMGGGRGASASLFFLQEVLGACRGKVEGHLVTSASMGRLAPAGAGTDKGEWLSYSGRSRERERQELDGSLVVQSGAVAERIGVALPSFTIACSLV